MYHLCLAGTKVYIIGPGHMTKMAATPIYGKNLLKIFISRTIGQITLKFGIQQNGLKPLTYINDDPELTLTYFTTRSTLFI